MDSSSINPTLSRFGVVSVPFVVKEPEDKGEWFSHLIGAGDLDVSEEYRILSSHFMRSSRLKFGPTNDCSNFPDSEKFSFTTQYKLKHDIDQMEVNFSFLFLL